MNNIFIKATLIFCVFISCVNTPKVRENDDDMRSFNATDEISVQGSALSPTAIEGYYTSDMDTMDSIIKLTITRNNDCYKYNLKTPKQKFQGTVNVSNNEYLNLKGIRWSRWGTDGDYSVGEWPRSVDVYIGRNYLLIQNYGNALHNYLIFDDIDEKYIRLVKK